jgi:hypothetical protein
MNECTECNCEVEEDETTCYDCYLWTENERTGVCPGDLLLTSGVED